MLARIEKWLRRTRETAGGGPDARYRLGVPSNLFSGALPEGIYYPDFTTLEDQRPLEFIALAEAAIGKPWSRCTILDIGCGEGTSTTAIGRTGARVIGIEGRPAVVARAKYLRDRLGYTNVEFRTGNVLDGSLWEQADAVFVSGLIHHLEQPFRLMELIAKHCSDLAYFCTHLAPRDEAHRSVSFFSGLLHEAGSVEFRGRALTGIRFMEGNDVREEAERRLRHPRAGIGNTYSWWPAEESFTSAMNAVGFPVAKRLAAHDYRLRYRYCFRRGGEIPSGPSQARPYLWASPERPAPEAAAGRSLAADIRFLKSAAISPVIMGTLETAGTIRDRLLAEGIRPSAAYLTGTLPGPDQIQDMKVKPHEALATDEPEFVIIAVDRVEEIRKRVGELVTLKSCRYAFTSFALHEIKEFPAPLDPVTGDPLAARLPSEWLY